MTDDGEGVHSERDALRREVADLTADRDRWRDESGHLQTELEMWRTEARHWRAETEHLLAAERRRLGWRLRQGRDQYARRTWRALPVGVRNQLRPLVFRKAHSEFIGPEPFQKDETPSA